MPISEIYIMMADWAATSEEKKGISPRLWFKENVVSEGGKKWKFTDEQLAVIKKCLSFFNGKINPSLKRDYGLETNSLSVGK